MHLGGGKFLQLQNLDDWDTSLGQQIGMYDKPTVGVGGWRLLQVNRVRTNHDSARFAQMDGTVPRQTRRLSPYSESDQATRAFVRCESDNVSEPELGVLVPETVINLFRTDPEARGQLVEIIKCGNIQEYTTRDYGRMLLRSADIPGPTADMLVRLEVIENLAVVPEVVQGIDVGTAMRVHRDCIAREETSSLVARP